MPAISVNSTIGEQRNAAGKLQKFTYRVGRSNTEDISTHAWQDGALSGFVAGTTAALPALYFLAPLAGIPTGLVGASVGLVIGTIQEHLANNKLDTMEEKIRDEDKPQLQALEAEMARGKYQVRTYEDNKDLVVSWDAV